MLVLTLSFSSFKIYKCPAGPIFKLGLEFSVGIPSGGGGGLMPWACRGFEVRMLLLVAFKKWPRGRPWKGQGGTSSLHLACELGLFGGFWFRAAAARAAPQTGRFPQA